MGGFGQEGREAWLPAWEHWGVHPGFSALVVGSHESAVPGLCPMRPILWTFADAWSRLFFIV